MKRIVLISDNHAHREEGLIEHIEKCDEIWHAGDMGSLESISWMEAYAPLRGVYGNVDGHEVRAVYPENQIFEIEGIKVFMTHIGGYPTRYRKRIIPIIKEEKPDLYICGHSHILKVVPDKANDLLHMNPGAYGHHGFHTFRTFLTFSITDGKIHDLNAVELGRRGQIDENKSK